MLAEFLQDQWSASDLQEIRQDSRHLWLGLNKEEALHWLIISMDPLAPSILPIPQKSQKLNLPKKSKLPMSLFLGAHFRGRALASVGFDKSEGRVIHFQFGAEHSIEVRLFPHGQNIMAFAEGKKIFFQKPKPLPEGQKSLDEPQECRSLQQLLLELFSADLKTPDESKENVNSVRWQKEVAKKKNLLEKMRSDLESKRETQDWYALGDLLKSGLSLDVPEPWKKMLDPNLNFSQNLQRAYDKAKLNEQKLERAKRKLAETERLLHELLELGSEGWKPSAGGPKGNIRKKTRKKEEGLRYRTLKLSEQVVAYLGRSSQDNLRLLREAQAWDLWLHIKDVPGAHMIIRRPRNYELSEAEFNQLEVWMVKESAPKRFIPGDIVEFWCNEVRYVQPIKGDKAGHVQHHNSKVRRLRVKRD